MINVTGVLMVITAIQRAKGAIVTQWVRTEVTATQKEYASADKMGTALARYEKLNQEEICLFNSCFALEQRSRKKVQHLQGRYFRFRYGKFRWMYEMLLFWEVD